MSTKNKYYSDACRLLLPDLSTKEVLNSGWRTPIEIRTWKQIIIIILCHVDKCGLSWLSSHQRSPESRIMSALSSLLCHVVMPFMYLPLWLFIALSHQVYALVWIMSRGQAFQVFTYMSYLLALFHQVWALVWIVSRRQAFQVFTSMSYLLALTRQLCELSLSLLHKMTKHSWQTTCNFTDNFSFQLFLGDLMYSFFCRYTQ